MAAEAVGPAGRVVGIDVAPIDPLTGFTNVVTISADLAQPGAAARILAALGGPADVLLSDAAPKLTGVRATDRAREEALLAAVEALVPELLRPGGDLLVKLLDSPEAESAARRLRARFARAQLLRPAASRKGTAEKYLLARGLQS